MLAGCLPYALLGLAAGAPATSPATSANDGRPNVVLIAWDYACSAADLATSDYPAPALHALADRSAVFARAIAPTEAGRPSRAALLSGLYPHQSGVRVQAGPPLELAGSLPRLLGDAGYASLAVGPLPDGSGEKRGFSRTCRELSKANDEVESFVAELGGKQPLFVWWAPDAPRGKKKDAVGALDRALAGLMGSLERHDLLQDTLIAFVPDSVSRSGAFQSEDCFEPSLRRPVMLAYPPRIQAGTHAEPISLLDLYPTLLELAGVAAPAGRSGRSLAPLLQGESASEREICAEFFAPPGPTSTQAAGTPRALAIYSGRWKYALLTGDLSQAGDFSRAAVLMLAGDQVLYDLESDPREQTNLVYDGEHEARAAELRAAMLRWWKESGGAPFDPPYVPPVLGPVPESRPNIVLVIADDQDYEHLGFMGNARARTPTLDALAREGVVFSVCHASMSVCRPSHASLLSGRWPHQTGIYDNDVKGTLERRDALPSQLKAAGYATFMAGKLWEGSPQAYGFVAPATKNDGFVREGQDELFAFIEHNAGKRPLFIWWAPWIPHVPHNPPERLEQLFRDTDIPLPTTLVGDPEEFRAAERKTYAMDTWLDEGLGQLRDELQRVKILENTLFVFLIDNGRANGFPSKGTACEKGLRTPVVFSWPKGFAGGRTDARLLSVVDIPATILDFAGAAPQPLGQGVSQAPAILSRATGDAGGRPFLAGAVYRAVNLVGHGTPETDVLALYARDERWKFVLYLRNLKDPEALGLKSEFARFPVRLRGDRDLFDLEADPYEQHDLADDPAQAQRLAELQRDCLSWWRSSGGGKLELP